MNDQQSPRQNAPEPPSPSGFQPTAPMGQHQYQGQSAFQQDAQPPYTQPIDSPQPAHRPQGKSGGGKVFLLAFVGAAAACVIAAACFFGYNAFTGKNATGSVVLGSGQNTTINASDTGEDRAEAVADKALPSVVAIDVYTSQNSYSSIFGSSNSSSSSSSSDSSLSETSLGSGVIISSDGYILTNYHVVEGADKLMVTANGEEHEATVVGTDETSDLAVIKIDASNLQAIEIGSSANLKAGQWVMTVGSPFGLEQSVATGIVSATSRTVTVDSSSSDSSSQYYSNSASSTPSVYANMIQTDAAINPGNSGGALVDENGKLIGINSVIESYSGNYSGVGFAIPVDYAIDIAQQIISGKTPTHAQLGVAATTVTSSIAQRYGLDASSGAYVSKVYSGSGAEAAGLQQGDIITKVNNTAVQSATDLIAAVRTQGVGTKVTITYVRNGSTQTADVTLGSDENTQQTSSSSSSSKSGSLGNSSSSRNGASGASDDTSSAADSSLPAAA